MLSRVPIYLRFRRKGIKSIVFVRGNQKLNIHIWVGIRVLMPTHYHILLHKNKTTYTTAEHTHTQLQTHVWVLKWKHEHFCYFSYFKCVLCCTYILLTWVYFLKYFLGHFRNCIILQYSCCHSSQTHIYEMKFRLNATKNHNVFLLSNYNFLFYFC